MPEDCDKDKSYLTIKVPGAKRGLPRTIYLPIRLPLIKELYKYIMSCPPHMFLFYHFRSHYKRYRKTPKGLKEYTEITDGLRYHIQKWFSGVIEDSITPYYLRHNRFSKLAEKGIDLQDIRMLKGSRTYSSVTPYLHMSSKSAKKISKKLD